MTTVTRMRTRMSRRRDDRPSCAELVKRMDCSRGLLWRLLLPDCIGEPAFPPSGPSPLIVVALGRERGCGCMAQWVGAMPRNGTSL